MTTRDAGAVGFGLFGVYLIVSRIRDAATLLLALSTAPLVGRPSGQVQFAFFAPLIVAVVCGCALVALRGWLADRLFAYEAKAQATIAAQDLMAAVLAVLGAYFIVSGVATAAGASVGGAPISFADPRLVGGIVQFALGVLVAVGHRPIAGFIGRLRGFGAAR